VIHPLLVQCCQLSKLIGKRSSLLGDCCEGDEPISHSSTDSIAAPADTLEEPNPPVIVSR
jgi:hypothetical protein